jgi:hypothetical protein
MTTTAAGTETRFPTTSSQRLIVVSYLAHAPFSPRGIRTRELLSVLRRDWSVELVARSMGSTKSAPYRAGRSVARKALQFAHSSVLLDKFELWSLRHFVLWRPEAAGALLIGFPFSPLVYASRRLAESGIPYVVDVGDPWVLTANLPLVRNLARARARVAEHRLWAGASGAVVSTDGQAKALQELFPDLPILVRPNGFPVTDHVTSYAGVPRQRHRANSVLRLAHFGDLSSVRVDIEPFLALLARSGMWKEVEFHEYGSDWTGVLGAQRNAVVVFHEPRPWSEIARLAPEYDLAVAIGNHDPKQLPSKAIAYLQLPVPRLAVVRNVQLDALAQYVADKPGWIVVSADGADAAGGIEKHLSRTWTAGELAPPATESWEQVSDQVAQFVNRVLRPHGVAPAAVGP